MTTRRLFVSICLLSCIFVAARAAVIGIDFGSEFVKVALVKPGTPFHIVIDEQSQRKVPHVIGFDESSRVFGNGATSLMVRKPKHTYMYAQTLLGRSSDSIQARLFKDYHYPYELVSVKNRSTVAFVHTDADGTTQQLLPEELVAMTFQHIRQICEVDAGSPVADAVITVPEFWTQKERQAMLDAAEVAGLNVLSLINENTAAAIQYGIDRKYSPNETHTAMFFNMGSTSTKVSLAEYSGFPERGKKNKTQGQFEVKAVAYDETLGGQAFEVRIMDWLVTEANKMLKTKGETADVRTNIRAMAKLRTQAIKAKAVLSANKDTPIFVVSLVNDLDFKSFLTREKFIELSSDLLARVIAPVKRVLDDSKLSASQVDSVIIIGGSVRIPAVQKALKDFLKRDDLAQNLNGDEAFAQGAVFRAANLSTQFQVRKFGMVDVTPFPVGVRLTDIPSNGAEVPKDDDSEVATEDEKEDDKEVDADAEIEDKKEASSTRAFAKRAGLFRRLNRLNKRKTVAFSHTRDLQCTLNHDVPRTLPAGCSSSQVAVYNVTGVEALIKDEANKRLIDTQRPKVALSFALDGSGLVELVKAEATLEEMIKVPVPKKINKTENATATATKNATETASAEGESTEGTAEAAAADSKEKEEGAEEEAKPEETAPVENDTAAAEEPEFVMKKKVHRFPLTITRGPPSVGARAFNRDDLKASKSKLAKLQAADEYQREIAQSKNNVESHIYNTRQSLEKDEWMEVSTEEQRDEVRAALEKAEEWLYEQNDQSAKPYKDKLEELKQLSDPILFRVSEMIERPDALNSSTTLITYTRDMLKRFETERPWLKAEDTEELVKMLDDVEAWLDKKLTEQEAKKPHETPAFASYTLMDKLRPIARVSTALLKRKKPIEKVEKPKIKVDKKGGATGATGATGANANGDAPSDGESATEQDTTGPAGAEDTAERVKDQFKDDL